MKAITEEVVTLEALHFELSPCRKCLVSSGDKVYRLFDVMDMQDLHSSLPLSSSSSLSSASAESNLRPLAIDDKSWLVGEKIIQQILSVIQPTAESECRRKEIIEYLQGLIADAFGIKVFPFGSVPFKTYLSHGDIDLTTVSHYGTSHDLATGITSLLEKEEKNNTKVLVRDVHCVPAQVKVVKCTVHGIAVDISFNQTAGLYALYFLEQVDQFIGKDHLFKRSVILIKAWCFYESRLLGGFHGLISTYALETMILHVINLFHSVLPCPLAVLYKFLEYYSLFDWDTYCVGINGLVLISSLPEIEVVPSENCDELLLTEDFLRRTREPLLSSQSHGFPIKFLNILDPLKDDNNLGRSVSKGNFFRIRCALSYGADTFRKTMMLSPEKIGAGIQHFFINTLEGNGKGKRADVLVPVPPYGSQSYAKNDDNDILAGIQYGLWFDDYDYGWNNNGWGEVNPSIQYDYNVHYDMEESLPSYVEEKWWMPPPSVHSPRGLQPNGDNWRSRSARSSVNNPRTFQLNNAGFYEENWKSKGNLASVDYYSGNRRKPRGTCAFIPQFPHVMQGNRNMEENGVERESRKEDENGNFVEKENSSVVNYSMDEFPLLPGSQPIPIRPSPVAYMKGDQVKQTMTVPDNSDLGSFKPPSPTPMLSASESVDVASDPTPVVEALEEDNYSSKSEEKTEVNVQLTDECEFPPLARPSKPVVVLSKKEFPPLRAASLKPKKKNKNDGKELKKEVADK